MTLSREQIARWEQLASSATEPPWRVHRLEEAIDTRLIGWREIASLIVESDARPVRGIGDEVFVVEGTLDSVGRGSRSADAAFIAAAREAVPALCACIRRLEDELAELRKLNRPTT